MGELSDLGIHLDFSVLGGQIWGYPIMLCFGLGVFRGQEWTGDIFILLCTLGRLTSTTTKDGSVPFLLSIAPEFVADRSTANQQEMLRNSKAPCGRWLLSRYSPKQFGHGSAGRGVCMW